jgi:imidazolonepropionase-like amidohydrolase
MVLDGIEWRSAIARHKNGPDVEFIRSTLSKYRELGYTYLRDGGDRWGVGAKARELAVEYGIRYRTPLAPLCKAGHYGRFIGETYENLREYAALVKKTRKSGGDFIKIMISGLMDFDRAVVLTEEGLPAHEIRELVRIAHEEGFAVMAHCNGADTIRAAAEAGVDSVEHGAYADAEALAAMVENKTVWVPTLSTVGNLRDKGRFAEDAVAAIFADTSEKLRLFASMGGAIACGSDAGAWSVPHDADTEENLLFSVLGEGGKVVLERGTAVIREKF